MAVLDEGSASLASDVMDLLEVTADGGWLDGIATGLANEHAVGRKIMQEISYRRRGTIDR